MFRTTAIRRAPQYARALATHASTTTTPLATTPSRRWSKDEIQVIYDGPLMDLVFRAASVHRQHFDPSKIQLCTLMNIKSMCPDHQLDLVVDT